MTDQTATAADRREYQREYYKKRKADRAAYQREYRRKHKAEYVAYCRQYYQEHKAEYVAYCRQYYQEHKADRAAYQREYRRKHKALGGRMTREEMRMFKCKRTVPLHYIMEAKVKPEGVSDVRWRIELSRRRLAAKERSGGGKGDLASLPDPDMMW